VSATEPLAVCRPSESPWIPADDLDRVTTGTLAFVTIRIFLAVGTLLMHPGSERCD
jgi:hypothetical protein